jgi:hypothetical protein
MTDSPDAAATAASGPPSAADEAAAAAAWLREVEKLKQLIAVVDVEIEAVDTELRAALWDHIATFKCKNIHSARKAEVVVDQQQCVCVCCCCWRCLVGEEKEETYHALCAGQ